MLEVVSRKAYSVVVVTSTPHMVEFGLWHWGQASRNSIALLQWPMYDFVTVSPAFAQSLSFKAHVAGRGDVSKSNKEPR